MYTYKLMHILFYSPDFTPATVSSGGEETAKGPHRGPPTTCGEEGPAPEATPGADYFGCHSSWEGLGG